MIQKINLNSGPSFVPEWVREQSIKAIENLEGSGLSIFEIGHRTKQYQDIVDELSERIKKLLQLSEDYEVMFLQGGASQQFTQIPYNFLTNNLEKAIYIQTGSWSKKAFTLAKPLGNVVEISASPENHLLKIPSTLNVPEQTTYVHLTSNETITGTQWKNFSALTSAAVPLVVDMSSDILSRTLDHTIFDFIYFGAQKNVGIAGVTIVVAKKSFLSKAAKNLPIETFSFLNILEAKGIPNTPPVFAVYVALQMMRWIEKEGGLAFFDEINPKKAKLIYDIIDEEPLFVSHIHPSCRSTMNIPFFIENKIVENEFLDQAEQLGFYGIRGHRTAGGVRLSIYNATSFEKVDQFATFMKNFAKTH